jgi:hypothetical protein
MNPRPLRFNLGVGAGKGVDQTGCLRSLRLGTHWSVNMASLAWVALSSEILEAFRIRSSKTAEADDATLGEQHHRQSFHDIAGKR